MSDTQRIRHLTPADARRIDLVCDRFESAWQAGPPPQVEDYLDVDTALRSVLLRHLLLLDWEYRRRAGDDPRPEEYHQRFPEEVSLVDEICREMAEALDQPQTNSEGITGAATSWTGDQDTSSWLPPAYPTTSDSRYHLLHEVGHGGIGVVFRARDRFLGREVAVKVLHAAHQDKRESRRRFIEEARVGSQLQHPAIVPVYELGAFGDERPFFTMKLVEGRTLAALLHGRRDPQHDLARWLSVFGQVCQAMAYAHAKGIVHRDLKPANIMVGLFGEVQVMDWGFAKQLLPTDGREEQPLEELAVVAHASSAPTARAAATTHSGVLMGTPAYMPPEQARGQNQRIDPRADVFALGALLCEILTGGPPYQGKDADEVCRRAVVGDLRDALARLDTCGADDDLCDLAKRCLTADYRHRLPDAGIVAQDFAAYLASAQERLRQAQLARAAAEARADEAVAKVKVERHARRLTLALAAAAVVLVMGLGIGWWWWQHLLQVEETRQAATGSRVEAALAAAVSCRDRGDWTQARAAALRAQELLGVEGNQPCRPQVEEFLADLELVGRIEENRRRQGVYDFASERFTREKALPHYRETFAQYGIAIGTDPTQAATRISARPVAIREAALAGLDNWWLITLNRDTATHAWLDAVLRQVDNNAWRSQVRQAIARRDRPLLEALARSADALQHPPAAITSLTCGLLELRAYEPAIALLRPAQLRHPSDFWINFDLAQALRLCQPPEHAESLRFYSIVCALRPDANIYVELGFLHSKQNNWDGVVFTSRKALELSPADKPSLRVQALFNLGSGLVNKGMWGEAEEVYRQVLDLAPGELRGYAGLGFVLYQRGQFEQAIDLIEPALRKFDLPPPQDRLASAENDHPHEQIARLYVTLGDAWVARKQVDKALAAFDLAIQRHPGMAKAHASRGTLLLEKKRLDEAIAAFEQAIRLEPALESAHANLGVAWQRKGQMTRAVVALRRALELDDHSASNHFNLGLALQASGELDKAAVHYRKAVQLDASLAQAHCVLGELLLTQGDFKEGLDRIATGHRLGSSRPDWPYPSAQWLKQAERLIALDAKLSGVLSGRENAANAEECLQLGVVCNLKGLHRDSARLLAAAFKSKPMLMNSGYRFQVACIAVKASSSQRSGYPLWEVVEQIYWRQRALAWLREDLTQWTQELRRSPAKRSLCAATLQRWLQEKSLAPVREPADLAKLPAPTRALWLRFWADVQELLVKSMSQTR